VPSFVSTVVREWQIGLEDAARGAGVDTRDLAAVGAYVESYPVPRPDATVADVVAHCEHVREVAGIDHIGIGGDYDGVDKLPLGLDDVSGYPTLTAALAERGWSSADLTKLGWRNVHRVLAEAEVVAAELRDRCSPSLARIEELDGPAPESGEGSGTG
jgi:membrane dipeptidase